MSYFDSEVREKAENWNVPIEMPRSIRGKFGIFKAAPSCAIIGVVFLPMSIFLCILFYSMGIMNDYLVDDWKPASAVPLRWINSTGERINNHYIPGIEVKYRTSDTQSKVSVVKVTKRSQERKYRTKCNNGSEIKIEYSENKPSIAKIEGMSATAMPLFIIILPFLFFIAGGFLLSRAFNRRSKIRLVLENGKFAVGRIVEKTKTGKYKGKSGKNSANRSIRVIFVYSADGGELQEKTYVSAKIGESVNVDQEIPVIYSSTGITIKAYSPLLLNVEYDVVEN
ncbi:MAG: hypothetical protein K8S87_08700 [Planctomycetes bacterium]|nr:hypothetical protein [Planctomycetota bacterium]